MVDVGHSANCILGLWDASYSSIVRPSRIADDDSFSSLAKVVEQLSITYLVEHITRQQHVEFGRQLRRHLER